MISKHKVMGWALFFLSMFLACPVAAGNPDKIKVGIYLTDIYGINFTDKSFSAQYWTWFIHNKESFSIPSSIEAPNARNLKTLNFIHDVKENVIWDQAKFEAVINKQWDITNYPFDRQEIEISLELADADASELLFVTDEPGSKISRDLTLVGWSIENPRIRSDVHDYDTAYGDPELDPGGPSGYSRVTLEFELKRYGWRLLFNDFIGFIFAIVLSSFVIIINQKKSLSQKYPLISKLSMATGSLFSAVGASYVMQARLPVAFNFTLADAIQLTAFAATLLAVVSSLVSEVVLSHSEKSSKSRSLKLALNFKCGITGLFIALIMTDMYFLIKAVNS